MLYLAVLMIAVFFAGFAMTVNEGLWSNAITLFCVVLAGMIAVPGGLALAGYVLEQAKPSPENEWAFEFGCIWGVFFFAVNVLRLSTDKASKVRMKLAVRLRLLLSGNENVPTLLTRVPPSVQVRKR